MTLPSLPLPQQVPRMLWHAGSSAELERHVLASDDAALLTWWARACEASSNFPQAISCYQRAGAQAFAEAEV